MAVAAEFPDIDMLWSLRGPVEGFAHHRGITHTLVGVPFEAALIVGTVYCAHRWRLKRSERVESSKGASPLARTPRPLTLAPVRWGVLYGFALIGLLSHLLLDYTNNYGIRPFFPFDRHWFAGSFVFIFDPLIFGLLVLGLLIPGLLGMIGAEVGVRPGAFRGRGWAIAALAGVLGCWGLRVVEHGKAVALAMAQSMQEPSRPSTTAADDGTGPAPSDAPAVLLTARRALATPGPLNPFAWSVATDFGVGYQLAEADVSRGLLTTGQTFYWKPGTGATVQAAEGSALGRAYLDWSPMPLVEVGDRDSEGVRTVTLRDPRFMGAWMGAMGHPQLEGTVEVDAAGKVVRQALDGRVER